MNAVPERRRPRSSGAGRPASRRGARVVAALLASALAAACTPAPTRVPTSEASPSPTGIPTTSTPGPTATASAAPTPGDTTPPVAACSAADLKASHGLVEGTAGSRETEVVLVTAVHCAVPAWPSFNLRGGDGDEVVVFAPAGGGGQAVVEPGGSYDSAIKLLNWCGPEPAWPITLELLLEGQVVTVTGGSFPEEGDLPPCSGSGLPTLSATAWAPSN